LEKTAIYGLRVYREGNALLRHVDRIETHIISAILHIDRDADEPWPIVIEDRFGVEHSVDLQPGQMLFYESARQPHARPSTFKGRFYCSVFVHYKPVGWDVTHDQTVAHLPPNWDRNTVNTPLDDVTPEYFAERLAQANRVRPPAGQVVPGVMPPQDNLVHTEL
jgi:hypothetical protein